MAPSDAESAAAITPPPSFDAVLPPAVAYKAARIGETKASLDWFTTFALGVLAGAFIALGAMFATTVAAGSAGVVPFGIVRLLAGLAFCLGLILVVVAGAELFTGNNLIVMAWADRRIKLARLLRNWGIVYAGNLVGAVATALIIFAAQQYTFGDGAVGLAALNTAQAKTGLGWGQAFALGVMCNALVCLAIWMAYSARSVADKVLAIVFPITAFVAAGFEHSIANMYFLPTGWLIKEQGTAGFFNEIGKSGADFSNISVGNIVLGNLVPVTLGNIVGGSLMVGIAYWLIYVRPQRQGAA